MLFTIGSSFFFFFFALPFRTRRKKGWVYTFGWAAPILGTGSRTSSRFVIIWPARFLQESFSFSKKYFLPPSLVLIEDGSRECCTIPRFFPFWLLPMLISGSQIRTTFFAFPSLPKNSINGMAFQKLNFFCSTWLEFLEISEYLNIRAFRYQQY